MNKNIIEKNTLDKNNDRLQREQRRRTLIFLSVIVAVICFIFFGILWLCISYWINIPTDSPIVAFLKKLSEEELYSIRERLVIYEINMSAEIVDSSSIERNPSQNAVHATIKASLNAGYNTTEVNFVKTFESAHYVGTEVVDGAAEFNPIFQTILFEKYCETIPLEFNAAERLHEIFAGRHVLMRQEGIVRFQLEQLIRDIDTNKEVLNGYEADMAAGKFVDPALILQTLQLIEDATTCHSQLFVRYQHIEAQQQLYIWHMENTAENLMQHGIMSYEDIAEIASYYEQLGYYETAIIPDIVSEEKAKYYLEGIKRLIDAIDTELHRRHNTWGAWLTRNLAWLKK